jgi:hypothetical protein
MLHGIRVFFSSKSEIEAFFQDILVVFAWKNLGIILTALRGDLPFGSSWSACALLNWTSWSSV